jgi:outer membrane receptor for Fe3+-dicitrate
VQSNADAERRESTASKVIINRDEITKYGDTNLFEVFKRLPGVTVDTGPGGRGARCACAAWAAAIRRSW